MYILCFTSDKGDLHTEYVFKEIDSKFSVLTVDTESFGKTWNITIDFANPNSSSLIYNKEKILIEEIHSVWWRKPTPVNIKYMKDEMASFVFRESNDTIYGFLWLLETQGCEVINHPFNNYNASMKPLQFIHANKLNLFLPKTLVTNYPKDAIDKINKDHCISKGVSMSWAIENDKNYPIFVKRINQEKIEKIDTLSFCPATIQSEIDKKYDVRIVVLKNEVFYFKIEDKNNLLDWRESLYGESIEYTYYEIDDAFKNKLIDLNKSLSLHFSVFDFVVDKNDKMYFLETNPNGQWLWLDKTIGYKISKTFAHVLSN
ncbi:MvdC/MvdD family ATP grasp protein [Pseudoalteromonas sp. ASV78]|uniref:MvdC/MvdD family ATP grasp protein n=1 Tax=Pseudoalteromonas sp. ASV78 TaxID=3397851 RepID=UPI0039FDE016